MAYNPTVYVNDNPPALNADNLNKAEQGIYDAHEGIQELNNDIFNKTNKNWSNINLSNITPINYRINQDSSSATYRKWVADSTYRSVLIPIQSAGKLKIEYTTYRPFYAFLKTDTVVAGNSPDYCDGTTLIYQENAYKRKVMDIPSDCNYLYIYVSDGSIISQFSFALLPKNTIVDDLEKGQQSVNDIIEVKLEKYNTEPYNLVGSTTWVYSAGYPSVFVPREELASKIKIVSNTYTSTIAFLKSKTISAGASPDLCTNTSIIQMAVGETSEFYVPEDCLYLCMYIGAGERLQATKVYAIPATILIQELDNKVDKYQGTEKAGMFLGINSEGNVQASKIGSHNRTNVTLNLTEYTPINFNLENKNAWASSSLYRGIIIPVADINYTNLFWAGEYKISFAFLRTNNAANGVKPDLCLGTDVVTLAAGTSKHYDTPMDCNYIYVYISNGTFFGKFGITALFEDFNEIQAFRNSEKSVFVASVEQCIITAKHRNSGVVKNFVGTNVADNLLTFAHVSDLHNDPSCYTRFINFLNAQGSLVDFGVVSGDLIDYATNAYFAEMIDCESALASGRKIYKCVGNHEVSGSYTLSELYDVYLPGSGDGSLYFKVDFATQKIRVIFLNQYDSEDADVKQHTGHYSQTQIDWFIAQLQDALTNNLSVIVVCHSMAEAGWPIYNKQGFYQQVVGSMYSAVNSGPIISDIINAFKHKGTLSKTYSFTDNEDTLTVSASFSGYGNFICYICGHEHVDVVGYSTIYPDQLICMVQGGVISSTTRTEASAHWQSKYDTPRIENTVTADSINVYSIDTVERLVKIVKVGSTITDKFEARSLAVFGY